MRFDDRHRGVAWAGRQSRSEGWRTLSWCVGDEMALALCLWCDTQDQPAASLKALETICYMFDSTLTKTIGVKDEGGGAVRLRDHGPGGEVGAKLQAYVNGSIAADLRTANAPAWHDQRHRLMHLTEGKIRRRKVKPTRIRIEHWDAMRRLLALEDSKFIRINRTPERIDGRAIAFESASVDYAPHHRNILVLPEVR